MDVVVGSGGMVVVAVPIVWVTLAEEDPGPVVVVGGPPAVVVTVAGDVEVMPGVVLSAEVAVLLFVGPVVVDVFTVVVKGLVLVDWAVVVVEVVDVLVVR